MVSSQGTTVHETTTHVDHGACALDVDERFNYVIPIILKYVKPSDLTTLSQVKYYFHP